MSERYKLDRPINRPPYGASFSRTTNTPLPDALNPLNPPDALNPLEIHTNYELFTIRHGERFSSHLVLPHFIFWIWGPSFRFQCISPFFTSSPPRLLHCSFPFRLIFLSFSVFPLPLFFSDPFLVIRFSFFPFPFRRSGFSFLVACYATLPPVLSVRLSVHLSICPFRLIFFGLWPHCICPNAQVTSNMAPAYLHATGVAVYLALFVQYSITKKKCLTFNAVFPSNCSISSSVDSLAC